MLVLPSLYRSTAVIPYAPNGPDDRQHDWDWTGRTSAIPSGLTIGTVNATTGAETFALHYTGLSRTEARTLEQFAEDAAGRKAGFWCPTFQQDFGCVAQPAAWSGGGTPPGNAFVKEWGYAENIYPLGAGFRDVALTLGGAWFLGRINAEPDDLGAPAFTADGFAVFGYSFASGVGDYAGTLTVAPVLAGTAMMRMPFVRFADDAITTRWTHPNFASIDLRVTIIPGETP